MIPNRHSAACKLHISISRMAARTPLPVRNSEGCQERDAGDLVLDNRQAGPTALRMQIGARLRRLREEKGIGRVQAGAAIRGSASKMSRLELGRHGFKARDVL